MRDLLLVAAGQFADRLRRRPLHLMASRAIHVAAAAAAAPAAPTDAGPETVEPGQRQVVGDVEAEREAFVLAIFADHADALPPSLFGGGAPAERADADVPRAYGLEAEDRRSSSVRPAPTRPAMPSISPRCSVNVADPGSSASTSSSRFAGVRGVRGKSSPTSRPTISRTISSGAIVAGPPPATRAVAQARRRDRRPRAPPR